jgi:phosphate transport system permease protein
MKLTKNKETLMHFHFLLTASVSIFAVALICVFLFASGIPAIAKIGFLKFVSGLTWKPSNDIYGIFPMILGSLYLLWPIIIGVPLGITYFNIYARFCPKNI